MGLGEIRLGEMGLGEMGLGEMGQNLSNKVATASRFKCLRYLTLRYSRYL